MHQGSGGSAMMRGGRGGGGRGGVDPSIPGPLLQLAVAPHSSLVCSLPGALCPYLPCTHLAVAVPAKPLCWGASAPSAPPAATGVHVGLGGGGTGARAGAAPGGGQRQERWGGACQGSAEGPVCGRACWGERRGRLYQPSSLGIAGPFP